MLFSNHAESRDKLIGLVTPIEASDYASDQVTGEVLLKRQGSTAQVTNLNPKQKYSAPSPEDKR